MSATAHGPKAVLLLNIAIGVEEPIHIEFRNGATEEDKRRVLAWVRQRPELERVDLAVLEAQARDKERAT